MIFLVNESTDAPYNLALEELLASNFDEEIFMLWRNRNAVIVGRNQNTAAEVNADFVRANNIQVVRRMTGGGAVYHDLGNINFTIVAKDRLLDSEAFARNARPVLEALKNLNVPAEFSGRNDILADGRKISGSAKTVLSDRTLFHGTLLFSADLSMLGEVLTPDPEKIRAKGIKSVRSRVANIREFLPQLDVEDFFAALKQQLLCQTGAVEIAMPETLQMQAEKLAETKYRTWQWNYGSNINYSCSNKRYFSFGMVQASFNVKENCIADLMFNGDFFGSRDIGELCEALNGLNLEPAILTDAVGKLPIDRYINGASCADVVSLFML